MVANKDPNSDCDLPEFADDVVFGVHTDNPGTLKSDINAIRGDGYGNAAGVIGRSGSAGVGVSGISGDIQDSELPNFLAVTDNGAFGVTGVGMFLPGVIGSSEIMRHETDDFKVFNDKDGLTTQSIGVLGISKEQTGVFGLGLSDIKDSDQLVDLLSVLIDPNANPMDLLNNTGIFGLSGNGVGVRGISNTDCGGWFASKNRAQVHLEPRFLNVDEVANTPGVCGDFMAVKDSISNKCVLYFHDGVGWKIVNLL